MMSLNKYWWEFYGCLGPRLSFGLRYDVAHINAYFFGAGIVYSSYDRKLWIGFWPRYPLDEGGYLYTYNWDIRKEDITKLFKRKLNENKKDEMD